MAWAGPENPITWLLFPFTNWMGWIMLLLAGWVVRRRMKKFNKKEQQGQHHTTGNVSAHHKLR